MGIRTRASATNNAKRNGVILIKPWDLSDRAPQNSDNKISNELRLSVLQTDFLIIAQKIPLSEISLKP